MAPSLQEVTNQQRTKVADLLHQPLAKLAQQCATCWPEREAMTQALASGLNDLPPCSCLFITDTQGIQLSDTIRGNGAIIDQFGRDRSNRPYLREPMPGWGFLLSDAYVSRANGVPSLAALHVLSKDGETLGYLGCSFDLRQLPIDASQYQEPNHWRQIKGDPSIRQLLFQQSRVESACDRHIDMALSILEELICERGVFQCVLHFSSSRATVWSLNDPYRYHILDHEALADPDICLAYPCQPYPEEVLIPASDIRGILENMRALRLSDETVYLRSASINLFNGMISLTFSCDGSHYMSHREFLDKSLAFWFGEDNE